MTDIPPDALRETWESVLELSLKLAARIEVDSRQRGEQFDVMVVVPRGSYYPANIVSRELGFGAVDLLHACISSYEPDSSERELSFKLGQMPSAEMVRGKNILIIEEVCDTGYTLDFLIKYLQKAGAGLIRIGVMHYKPGRNQTGFRPDWFMTETDQWIVYPWEISEAHGRDSQVRRNPSLD